MEASDVWNRKKVIETVQGATGFTMTLVKPAWAWGIVYFIPRSNVAVGISIIILMIWDNLNGVLFRRSWLADYNWLRWLRRCLDAGGDRFVIHFVLVMMITLANFPLTFYMVVLVRELILLAVVSSFSFYAGRLVGPNWWSRSGTICIGLTAISWLLLPKACIFFLVLMVILAAIGIGKYIQTALKPA